MKNPFISANSLSSNTTDSDTVRLIFENSTGAGIQPESAEVSVPNTFYIPTANGPKVQPSKGELTEDVPMIYGKVIEILMCN